MRNFMIFTCEKWFPPPYFPIFLWSHVRVPFSHVKCMHITCILHVKMYIRLHAKNVVYMWWVIFHMRSLFFACKTHEKNGRSHAKSSHANGMRIPYPYWWWSYLWVCECVFAHVCVCVCVWVRVCVYV